ncbi:MAG: molybdate ABC transporter substrate-binding protein [Pseudomonadota bacterium]
MRTNLRCIRCLSFLVTIFLLVAPAAVRAEQRLTIAAGAGYKRLVEELCTSYTNKTGVPVNKVFGNMGQITAQAQESGAIDFIMGDKTYLDSSKLLFAEELILGRGKLVAAAAKGTKIKNLDALTESSVQRIAIADSEKAIYGHAAREFLTARGIWQQIQPKLLVVGTVPQVTAYLLTGEIDIGFINLTEALAIKDKVEILFTIDEKLYSPILIVAKQLQQSTNIEAGASLVAFLQSEQAQTLLKKQGL